MPPLLLAQQITTTISTRAKVGDRVWYCALAAFGSHLTWILSNSFALWEIGRSFSAGANWKNITAVLFYASWATMGNMLGQVLAMKYEDRLTAKTKIPGKDRS